MKIALQVVGVAALLVGLLWIGWSRHAFATPSTSPASA